MSLAGKHALVTGGGRGIGRGIAIGLGECGAKVSITGRSEESLQETIRLVETAGGECIPIVCDHSDDAAVENLWKSIGHVDIVVNNAYSGVEFLKESGRVKGWKKNVNNPTQEANADDRPGAVWDMINNVGLRNNYICSVYAFRKFEAQGGKGILINISSFGGLVSIFDPAYCIGKSGVDRLGAEFAKEAPKDVICFTYYPGAVATERLKPLFGKDKALSEFNAESPLFVGRALAGGLKKWDDGKFVKSMHGKIVVAAELARKVGVKDENGKTPLSLRSLRMVFIQIFPSLETSPLLNLVPNILIPMSFLQMSLGIIKFW